MQIEEIMTASPLTVRESTTIGQAREMLRTLDIRHLPVVNADGELVGIVSDRDFATPPSPALMTEHEQLIVVLAATNRPDVLDPALLRPGRFDRRVIVDRPELTARRAILGVHAKSEPLGSDVDLQAIAESTPGFSGADLANLVNEAAINATRRGPDTIAAADFAA